MIGHLYVYPHPFEPGKYLYVGQGPKRDSQHRRGKSSFGRRFYKAFLGVQLPEPKRWTVEVKDGFELNEEETIAMFRYHTWRGYDGGMNVTFPGSDDYKNWARIAGQMNVESGHWAQIVAAYNNSPEGKAHHMAQGAILQSDPIICAKRDVARIEWNSSPEVKEKFVARARLINANPLFRAKRDAAFAAWRASPEGKKQVAELGKKRVAIINADPEIRARRDAGQRKWAASPEGRAQNAANAAALHTDPKFQARRDALLAALNADSDFQAKRDAWKSSPDGKAHNAALAHVRWHVRRGITNINCVLCWDEISHSKAA